MRIKYCGGCRAQYDRVGLVHSLKARIGEEIRFIPGNGEEAGMVLIVNGCATACADTSDDHACPSLSIKTPEDAEKWVLEMMQVIQDMRTSRPQEKQTLQSVKELY